MAIDPVAAQALTYYVGDRKLTPDVAAGITAVLYGGESRLNPGSQGAQPSESGGVLNPSGAYGIASWNDKRQADLLSFATRLGLPVVALETQLHFVLTESANSYPAVWAAITNPATTWQEMITVFTEKYEVPKDSASEIARSSAYGPDFLAFAKTVQPVAGVVVPPAPSLPTAPDVAVPPQSNATAKTAILAMARAIEALAQTL